MNAEQFATNKTRNEDLMLKSDPGSRSIYEYIWIDGNGNMRSKQRVISTQSTPPDWNFDGSSTGQATGKDSEVILKPRKTYVLSQDRHNFLVLCDTWHRFKIVGEDGKIGYSELIPALNNNRNAAKEIFDISAVADEHLWFGLEQEYFLKSNSISSEEHSKGVHRDYRENLGNFYCGVGAESVYCNERVIVDTHIDACMAAGINISGTNAEVAPSQWEFQIGPCEGIDAADQLWAARYLLVKIAGNSGYDVLFDPKLDADTIQNDCPSEVEAMQTISVNGSGCHANFSTKTMRDCPTKVVENPVIKKARPFGEQLIEADPSAIKRRPNGVSDYIMTVIERLANVHNEHMLVYGEGNDARMTGNCETARFDQFTYGVGDRGVSVRIPTEVFLNGCGYIEDRRPAANADPYLVTSFIARTAVQGNACKIQVDTIKSKVLPRIILGTEMIDAITVTETVDMVDDTSGWVERYEVKHKCKREINAEAIHNGWD